jgi:homoprotocatechuate degradation regulator HpaR
MSTGKKKKMSSPTTGGKTRVRLRSFSNSLPMTLLKARETVMQRFRPSLRLFNITEQQWRVLRALSGVESCEVTVLANATYLLAPSLSRILKDLEDRNLVTRHQVSTDLRRTQISITPEGLRLIDAVAPYSESAYAEITSTFGEDRMRQLQALLRDLEECTSGLEPVDFSDVTIPSEVVDPDKIQPRGRPRKSAS